MATELDDGRRPQLAEGSQHRQPDRVGQNRGPAPVESVLWGLVQEQGSLDRTVWQPPAPSLNTDVNFAVPKCPTPSGFYPQRRASRCRRFLRTTQQQLPCLRR